MRTTFEPKRQRIAILTFSEVKSDPRIRRAADLMVSRGHEVRVYTLQFGSKESLEDYRGFRIIRLPLEDRYYRVEIDAFRAALKDDLCQVIDTLWPDILDRPWWDRPDSHKVEPFVPSLKQLLATRLRPSLPGRLADAVFGPMSAAPAAPANYYLNSAVETRDIADTYWRMQVSVELFRAVGEWATHIYANDLDTLFAGVMLKQAHGVCLIYDAHEIWPQQWSELERSAHFVGFFSTMERVLLRYTDERLTVGDGLARYFECAYASKPYTVVHNTPSLEYLCDESIVRRRSSRRGLLYHGLYMPYRGLEEVMLAVPKLEDCRVAFRGIGGHEQVLRQFAAERGLDQRVEFLPPLEVQDLVSGATPFDIGLLPFVNACLNTNFAFPNKLFEYMMAGLALAANDLVDLKRVITEHEMGIVFNVNDPNQVAEQLNALIRDTDRLDGMRYNAWRAAKEIYNWENSSLEMAKLLDRCAL